MKIKAMATCVVAAVLVLTGCGNDGGKGKGGAKKKVLSTESSQFPVTVTNATTGKTWTILGILTDGHNFDKAKANAEDTLVKHDDVAAMVGLWAYNPPKILQAVTAANKLGKVKIVGFDEDPNTLKAIEEGHIEGTVVQSPYGFGYRSVEYLAAMVRGQKVDVPKNKLIFIPTRVITKENVSGFKSDIEAKRAGTGTPLKSAQKYDTSKGVKVAFVTNSIDPFWDLAERGCEKAAAMFNAKVQVLKPPTGKVEEQNQFIEELITQSNEGLALSPIDAKNQTDVINKAAKSMKVIMQDSDAPDSDRMFYIGTDNYAAGRQAGELVAKVCPEGGKVMIFVGKMEVLNAQERSQGLIDVLLGQ